jgi:hypothetical protein
VPNDSASRDSVKPAPPTTGRIAVTAPENATITFLGKDVAFGNGWRSDTLRPGEYQVTATVPSAAECANAQETQRTRVVAGRVTRLTLRPRACGTLSFDALPNGARWTLKSLAPGDSVHREGVTPAKNVVLPVGEYERVISHSRCTNYSDTVAVEARDKQLPRRSPICG